MLLSLTLTSPTVAPSSPLTDSHVTFVSEFRESALLSPVSASVPSLLERVRKAKEILLCSSDTGKTRWKPDGGSMKSQGHFRGTAKHQDVQQSIWSTARDAACVQRSCLVGWLVFFILITLFSDLPQQLQRRVQKWQWFPD